MDFIRYIVLFSLLICAINGSAQKLPPISAEINKDYSIYNQDTSTQVMVPLRAIKTTAFFCVLEEKIERKTIPIRMRLGTLEYVNKLEQKTNTDIWENTPQSD